GDDSALSATFTPQYEATSTPLRGVVQGRPDDGPDSIARARPAGNQSALSATFMPPHEVTSTPLRCVDQGRPADGPESIVRARPTANVDCRSWAYHPDRSMVPPTCGLPDWEDGLAAALANTTVPLSSVQRTQVVSHLHGHMSKWVKDSFPSRVEYDNILTAFFTKYPHVNDQASARLGGPGDLIRNRQNSWRRALQRKWKYSRSGRTGGILDTMRAKFGRPAPRRVSETQKLCSADRKRDADPYLPQCDEGETPEGIHFKRERLNSLWCGETEAAVEGEFDNLWSTSKITKEAGIQLCRDISVQQIHDFCRMRGTRANCALKVHEISKRAGNVGLECTRYRGHVRGISADEEADIRVLEACLPFLAREKAGYWIRFETSRSPRTLNHSGLIVVAYPGEDGTYSSGDASFVPYIYNERVCSDDHLGVVEAFVVLCCVCHLGSFEFGTLCPNSWRSLSEAIFGFPLEQAAMTDGYVRLLNRLTEKAVLTPEALALINDDVREWALQQRHLRALLEEEQGVAGALQMTKSYISDVALQYGQSVREVLQLMGLTSEETQRMLDMDDAEGRNHETAGGQQDVGGGDSSSSDVDVERWTGAGVEDMNDADGRHHETASGQQCEVQDVGGGGSSRSDVDVERWTGAGVDAEGQHHGTAGGQKNEVNDVDAADVVVTDIGRFSRRTLDTVAAVFSASPKRRREEEVRDLRERIRRLETELAADHRRLRVLEAELLLEEF
ncbi:Sterile alpha motif domain-containing protein 3, partial [Frankliniella fusca]